MSNRKRFSIQRGWMQVRKMDSNAVKGEIMAALGLTSDPSWHQRLYGYIEPKVSEYEAINAIFAKYGIKRNIWGLEAEAVTELETSKSE